MPAAAKLGIEVLESSPTDRRAWLRVWYRRMETARLAAKYLATLLMIVVIGYADYVSGEEVSFSLFYLMPIAYAAWFIDARTGIFAALICATVWFTIEVTLTPGYSHPLIPVWNALSRLAFFVISVGLVTLVKRAEMQLQREVSQRTLSLREESERRQRLEREMLEISAREQVRLAQDLHDGLGQYLSALSFHARILTDDLRQQQSPLTPQAERLAALIRRTNQITRQLDRALRVPEGGHGGLPAALRALAAEFEQLTGVRCKLEIADATPALDEFRTLMLFRIVQEALNNAVKHARPHLILMRLAVAGRTLTVSILDDGDSLPKQGDTESGSGLRIMKLRAELIGAQLHAGAAQAGGYKVECVFPLPGMEAERAAG